MSTQQTIEKYADLLSEIDTAYDRLVLVTSVGYVAGVPVTRDEIDNLGKENKIVKMITDKCSDVLAGNEEGFFLRDVKVFSPHVETRDFRVLFVRYDAIIGCTVGVIR